MLTFYQGAHIMLAGIVFQLGKPYRLLNWTEIWYAGLYSGHRHI